VLNEFRELPATPFDLDEEAKAYVCELERQINTKNHELEQAAQYARGVENAFASSTNDVRRLEAALTASIARQDALSVQLTAMKQSKSWRTTEPLRVLMDLCRRFARTGHLADPKP
jgi:septal ring factor EnvC (AmiA/AmiB activator)